MRDVKFRGKDKNGKWHVGDLVHDAINCFGHKIEVGIQLPTMYPTAVIPETVGEFTGLLDKNYNEIFEGDVVNVGEMPALQDVVIRDIRYLRAILYEVERHVWIEVIGNIHDNPELLK